MTKQPYSGKSIIFINPRGFIEQHFIGLVSPESTIDAIKQITTYVKKQQDQGKPVLILEDLTEVAKSEFLSPKMSEVRHNVARATKELKFDKAAAYGPLSFQVIVASLALMAGKRNQIMVFGSRTDAIKWLLKK
jgi:preprotein translocase subunit SecA